VTLKAWIYGLLSGVIASAANAGSAALGAMVFAPELLKNGHFWEVIAATAAFAGLKTALAWLAKSPLPDLPGTKTVEKTFEKITASAAQPPDTPETKITERTVEKTTTSTDPPPAAAAAGKP
jgi:hypothetical protein